MKKAMKEFMTNPVMPTVLTIICALLVMVAVYRGMTAAVIACAVILAAAIFEFVVVLGVAYGIKASIELIREWKEIERGR